MTFDYFQHGNVWFKLNSKLPSRVIFFFKVLFLSNYHTQHRGWTQPPDQELRAPTEPAGCSNSKIFKQEDLYYYTVLSNTEKERALVLPIKSLDIYHPKGSFCYKIRVSSGSNYPYSLSDHLLLSSFRMKGLISTIRLSFSISFPKSYSLCIP